MPADSDIDRFDSRRSTVYASGGVVATSQPLAARTGARVLEDGGNAFDAAVATAAALAVVEPMNTGIGGDVFSLYRTADGDVGGMQACGRAPASASYDDVRHDVAEEQGADPESVSELPAKSPHAVTVPGTVRGWEATLERHGTRSLGDVLESAIRYAREGYPVTEVIGSAWGRAEELLRADEDAREEFLRDGRAPRAGEQIRHPHLGDSLAVIAEEGADVVYEGAIADAIVETVQDRGGHLAVEDLAAFEPMFVDPDSVEYGGTTVYELPPTNQGPVAIGALAIADAVEARSRPYESADRVHAFAESLKRAFHDGRRYIADPDAASVPVLHDRAYARRRADEVCPTATDVSAGDPPMRGSGAENADTVLLCVADGEGNVVSYINSLFHGFGSGIVAEGTGIVLQNRGACFSLDPDHPNRYEGGKQPYHTLIPGIVRFGSDDWAAFGVMGGYMQPQGHLQVISNLLDYDMSLQHALDAPRWRYFVDGTLGVEERFPAPVATKLDRRGHDVRVRQPWLFGGGQIARYDGGVLSAATEPRKDGIAVGF